MLDDDQLEALLADDETDRMERKASFADKEKICEAICAFANDLPDHRRPGVVYIGVSNDGSCADLAVTDELLQNIGGIRSDGNILPLPTMTVQKRTLSGCEMAVVEVSPSPSPPVRYRGRTYIRIGPRRGIATRDDERLLSEKRQTADRPFDHQPEPGATLADLDMTLFERVYLPAAVPPDVIAANERSIEQQLSALHFLDRDGSPNVAAVLVLGYDPRAWIPGAYVQFVRFDGTELTDPIQHQQEISGALPDLLGNLDQVLSAQIAAATTIGDVGSDTTRPDYPLAALTQVARNAILHRSYEATNAPVRIYWFRDRVEIHSPGGPFGQVTVDNFGTPGVTDYRNPLIAEAMKILGHVQRFGLGIPLTRKLLDENGNPPPEFEVQPSAVMVRMRPR